MAVSKKPAGKLAVDWKSPGSADELGPAEQVAHSIVSDRPDLFPSVQRIMSAELDGAGQLRALTLFRDALRSPGDPNRDPRVAIARSQADASDQGTQP